MRVNAKWVGAGLLAAAGAAAGAWYYHERSTERPNHRTILEEDAFELRAYPPLLLAGTVTEGGRAQALDRGFAILADYIGARSRPGEAIATTAPVIADKAASGWRTRFVMPGKWRRATLPPPPEGVEIEELPGRRVAVVRFAGTVGDRMLAEREAALRAWMRDKGLSADAPAEHAFYNSPFIPGRLRKNEIWIPV